MNQRDAALNGSEVRRSDYSIPDDLGRWQPWEATAEAIGEYKREVAEALDLSYPMIQRQCRPHNGTGTGKRTDLERIGLRVNCLRDLRVDENRAMLEVWWLNDFLGYRRPLPNGGVIVTESGHLTAGRVMTGASELVWEAMAALDDGVVTELEEHRLAECERQLQIALDNFRLKRRSLRARVATR